MPRRPTIPAVRRILLFSLSLLAGLGAAASPAELGRPLIQSFTRLEHKAHAQFWAPFQSPEGLMYFGNQLAVLEYDGRTWRVLKIPPAFVRAMAPAPNGDIYVGHEDQLGVLAKPDSGPVNYTSLLDRVPADAKPFGTVRDVQVWRGDVYFATDKNILRYRQGVFRAWPLAGDFRNRLFTAGERLILHRQGEALYEFDGEDFRGLSRAPELAAPTGYSFVVAADGGRLLVGLHDRGLYLVGPEGALTPWASGAEAILRRTHVLTGRRLHDGALAVGTAAEGLLILAPDGTLLRHVTRDNGLPQDSIISLGEDRAGGLWAGTNNGPARIDWRSAATVFTHQHSGLTDARATDIKRHDGILYYLSNDGLFRLVPSAAPRQPARFERDPRVDVQVRLSSLLSTPHGLLLAAGRGLQRLTATGTETLAEVPDGLVGLTASKIQPERIYFAHGKGVGTGVFLPDGRYRHDGNIAGIAAESYDVIEEANGGLWVGTISKGVYRAERAPGAADWAGAKVTRYTTTEGLPADHGSIYLWDSPAGMLFDTAQGIYRFDAPAGRFEFHRELVAFESRKVVLNPVAAGAPGELWTNAILMTKEIPYPLLRLQAQPGGKFSATPPPAEIQDFFSPLAPHRIHWEPGATGRGVIWAKGDFGLLRIDLAQYAPPAPLPPPLIRQITGEGRELVFPRDNPGDLRLKFSREPMTITFASGLFHPVAGERFQTRLVGFNDSWTAPTARNDVTYTNLEGGPFRFEVRGLDRQGRPGPVTGFTFAVTPPWPRSPAAYAGYALLALAALYGVIRWRLRAAEREQRRLETLVAERTAQLAVARDEAQAANRAKSTFLAHMSHELRTPLNGVIGYAQVLLGDRTLTGAQRERVQIVHASGTHLLHLINEVLDFSKIEAGRIERHDAPFHPGQLLRELASLHAAAAAAKGLAFTVTGPAALPEFVRGDPQKLRQVLDNLLSNAVKFTRTGRVELAVGRAGSPDPADDHWEFSVSDTGVGLSGAELAGLFQPFAQAAGRPAGESGTGLGLVITRRLVQLLGGDLRVDSTPGQGSRFAFTLALPAAAAPRGSSRPPFAAGGYEGPARRVLIVDDHAVNRTLLAELLRPLGFVCDCHASAEDALAVLADARPPDIAFLDVKLPGMDGLELTRRLRARPATATLPIVLTSASVLTFDAAAAAQAGSHDFLPKPFVTGQLLELLTRLLGLTWREAPAETTGDAALAPELRPALLAAADAGDVAALRAALRTARERQPSASSFIAQLEKLAAAYQLERVRQLLRDSSRP